MSIESYIDAIRPRLVENGQRARRVGTVIDMLRLVVRNHTQFDDASEGIPMETVTAHLNPADPGEIAWFMLYDKDGKEIEKAHTADMTDEDRPFAVSKADFMLSSNTPGNKVNQPAFTITTEPPNVLNYEDKPLTLSEIDGVIVDLQRYGNALAAGK